MNVIKCCLNWKVIGGLLLLGAILLMMTPGIGTGALPVLFMLACPLSMLVMLPLMMKGINADNQPVRLNQVESDQQPVNHAEQISRLKSQMAFLQSQQQVLVEQINQLEIPRGLGQGQGQPAMLVVAPSTAGANPSSKGEVKESSKCS